MSQSISYGSAPALDNQRGRLFMACFVSMFATSFAFIVRALLLTEWGEKFNLSEAQKGAILPGAALFPFAISIVLFSLFIDRIGYGKTMVFAWIAHVVGTVVTMSAGHFGTDAYMTLYIGTFITSLANGAVEAVVNPVVATIYPDQKTHRLNILHAGWPGGLVIAGALGILMGPTIAWEWKVGLVLIPTVIYGIMLIGIKFPVQERVAAGVSYRDMMREFGAAGAFILAYFLMMATLTVISVFLSTESLESGAWLKLNNWAPVGFAALCAILFFVVYQSFGRPMFVFLLLVMILLATTELGTDGWITDLLTPVFGQNAGWILVYTSAIMFVMRFFAGPIVHKISPLGLLAVCSAIAVAGLLAIAGAGNSGMLVFLAATLYGIGKSFFWPTTLGVVAEQFPRGGALTLNAMGGMGMIAVGVLGGQVLGAFLDKRIDARLEKDAPVIHDVVAAGNQRQYLMEYHVVDKARVKGLSAEDQNKFKGLEGEVKQGTLSYVAVLPAIMLLCYIAMILYFKSKGGYRAEVLTGHAADDEKFTGGVKGPVEA